VHGLDRIEKSKKEEKKTKPNGAQRPSLQAQTGPSSSSKDAPGPTFSF